jgi:glutathione S-transferase
MKLIMEGLRYSPWTERARWALDHHEIPYDYREHVMMLSMPKLWWEMGRPAHPVTVPVLLLGNGKSVMESVAIARWADQNGRQPKLFMPDRPERDVKIMYWSERGEEATDAARGAVLVRMGKNPAVQKASLPPFIPPALRGPLAWMTMMGVHYISREFHSSARSYEEHRERIRKFAAEVRQALKGEYLVDEFSFADVAVASALGVLRPVSTRYVKVDEEIRKVWTDEELADEFADLLAWRDRIYEKHRKRRIKPPS